jgi:hypothetical protein
MNMHECTTHAEAAAWHAGTRRQSRGDPPPVTREAAASHARSTLSHAGPVAKHTQALAKHAACRRQSRGYPTTVTREPPPVTRRPPTVTRRPTPFPRGQLSITREAPPATRGTPPLTRHAPLVTRGRCKSRACRSNSHRGSPAPQSPKTSGSASSHTGHQSRGPPITLTTNHTTSPATKASSCGEPPPVTRRPRGMPPPPRLRVESKT